LLTSTAGRGAGPTEQRVKKKRHETKKRNRTPQTTITVGEDAQMQRAGPCDGSSQLTYCKTLRA
jgi:hypothetical protein